MGNGRGESLFIRVAAQKSHRQAMKRGARKHCRCAAVLREYCSVVYEAPFIALWC